MVNPLNDDPHITLVINPIAGRGTSAKVANPVLHALQDEGLIVRAVRPVSAKAAECFIASLPAGSIVAALGGDGFLRNAVVGCLKSGAILAPLPGGRGNDFCRYLDLPIDAVAAAKNLLDAKLDKLDVCLANGQPFLGTACMGFDGFANKAANEAKYVTSNLVYAWGALKTAVNWTDLNMRIKGEGIDWEGKSTLADVGGTGLYGGGMKACPEASLRDGLLDVVMWEQVSPHKVLPLVLKAFKGTHVEREEVHSWKVPAVTIEADYPGRVPVFADGDDITELPATFEVLPGALQVLA